MTSNAPVIAKCPDCQGTGQIQLFTSVSDCQTCKVHRIIKDLGLILQIRK